MRDKSGRWQRSLELGRCCLIVQSALLFVFHPELYLLARQAHMELAQLASSEHDYRKDLPAIQAWPSVYTVWNLLVNRESPLHRDVEPPAGWLDCLLSFGKYIACLFAADTLGEAHDYPPGTLVLVNASRVRHGASRFDGDRACLISYMRQSVANYLGLFPDNIRGALLS